MPRVSIVIPCFNQGKTLDETVESVHNQTFSDYEIIVVNDGSTDQYTSQLLTHFNRPKTKVIHTQNKGLASARNNGIRFATGDYILPLDADDRIEPEYLEKAVDVLEKNTNVGIVYCRAQLFGAVDTEWLLPEYSLSEILKDNLIFCTAMFRRSDWEAIGGYYPGMIYGWEDYDFWLSLIERGREVYKIPEILFAYRVSSDSMVRSKEKWQKVAMFKKIYERHQKLFSDNIEVWIEELLDVRERYYTSRLYVDCGEGITDDRSVSRKVEKGTSIIDFQLDGFKDIKKLRFDPIDVPVIVEVPNVILKYRDNSSRKVRIKADNALLKVGNDRCFADDDPQCFLDVSHENMIGAVSLRVQISFKFIGHDALVFIIDHQQHQHASVLKKSANSASNIGALKAFFKALRKHNEENLSQYLARQFK